MELPKINDKIELRVLQGPDSAAYSTYVEDVTQEVLVIVRPTVGGQLVRLERAELVRIEYPHHGSGRLSFAARVLELTDSGLPLIVLALPERGEIERFQQRDFVRLEVSLKLRYSVLFTPGATSPRTGVFESETRDLSGNGAQILCPECYPPGTQLDLHFAVAGTVTHLVGEVIRRVEVSPEGQYWLGLRFVGLEDHVRDRIIRYIFQEQRELRRLGLL